jgi:threonine synthase
VVRPSERQYQCTICGRGFTPDVTRWCCDCGGVLDLSPADTALPDEVRSRAASAAVPVVPLRLGDLMVSATIEYASPTRSFKDRGAAVLVAKASELGATRLIADSSGNAGTAIAARASRAGLQCDVFVPAHASASKLSRMRAHGAVVHEVKGSREEVATTAVRAVDAGDAFYASHVWNPFFLQGTKTWAYDVWLALGRAPDVCVLPAGNGTLFLGALIGFTELARGGVVDMLPRLVAVQASACAPIAAAHAAGRDVVAPASNTRTVAEGIAIVAPVRGAQVLAAVRATGGTVVAVDEAAIRSAERDLARQGHAVEPTAAAVVAGAAQWLGTEGGDPGVVAVPLTGAG